MASSECSAGNDSNIVLDNAHPTLENIRESGEALQSDPGPSADGRIRREKKFQEAITDQTKAQTEQIRDTGKLRDKYAGRVYTLLKWWVWVAVLLLVLDALDPPSIISDTPCIARFIPAFDVEKQVMLAFLGSTTIAVVGLVLAVVKGLFPDPTKN
jgi:hypothetical protein